MSQLYSRLALTSDILLRASTPLNQEILVETTFRAGQSSFRSLPIQLFPSAGKSYRKLKSHHQIPPNTTATKSE